MVTMSDSSPADLAIAFRSLARRLREAQGDLSSTVVGSQLSTIDQHVARAAALVRASADPGQIADAIEGIPADSWGDELDELRTIALELGTQIRAVAAANPDLRD
jgi:hypothetical protein